MAVQRRRPDRRRPGAHLEVLGRSLPVQVARLLDAEAIDGRVPLPQRTLAVMLGVQRPSLNKILKEFERDGLIAIHDATIDIVNPARLRKLAGNARE
jgi:CRP/FNR family transcriptional regulator, cAMP and macrophage regulator